MGLRYWRRTLKEDGRWGGKSLFLRSWSRKVGAGVVGLGVGEEGGENELGGAGGGGGRGE